MADKCDPIELAGIAKSIDSVKSAFPSGIKAEPEVKQHLDAAQKICDDRFKEVTGKDRKDITNEY